MEKKRHSEDEWNEGDSCPDEDCQGTLEYGEVEGCSCHLFPPCSACVNNPLACSHCGEEPVWPDVPAPQPAEKVVSVSCPIKMTGLFRPYMGEKDYGDGRRLFNCRYDGSSGSTMEWTGQYEGPVTAADIVERFGSGTFGHNGPYMNNGRFTYTMITD